MKKHIYILFYFAGLLLGGCATPDCTFDLTMTCSSCSDIYELSAPNIYSVISGTGKFNTQIKIPNVPIQVSDGDYFEGLPNKAVGEFTTMEIVEITENYFYLKYSDYDINSPDVRLDYEIEEFEIIQGSIEDYQNGEVIKLKHTEAGKLAYLRNSDLGIEYLLTSFAIRYALEDINITTQDTTGPIISIDKNILKADYDDFSLKIIGLFPETTCAELYE